MTFTDFAFDKFACGDKWESTVNATMVIVSICLSVSIILFMIRLYQVIQENIEDDNRSIIVRLFQGTHLLAMFSSCFYLFLYEWNYGNWYTKTNPMDCGIWFEMIMFSITISKIFIYTFLMLRTTLSFSSSVFEIPLKLSIPIIILSCCSQLTMMGLMISDYTPTSPFPFNGFCFRILGKNGVVGIAGFNFSDALSGFVACIIFWWKSKQVQVAFGIMQQKNKQIDKELIELKEVFRKHIFFGMIIFMGSILIFFAGEFLTVLMGVASALHQMMNNIYIFLLFKQNIPIYNRLCCRYHAIHKQTGNRCKLEVELAEIQVNNVKNKNNDEPQPTEGRYKWSEFNTTKMSSDVLFSDSHIIDSHLTQIEKRGSIRSRSTFEIAPYKPYNSPVLTTKKSNSYTDLKSAALSRKKDDVITNKKIIVSHQPNCDNVSMSTPMWSTPVDNTRLTPMFNGDTGGQIKLMDVPTQSSMHDLSHTVPAYELGHV